jgi:uncharacterized protein (DUF2225 family)
MKRMLLTFCGIIAVVNIFASTGRDVEYVCPLCNTKFEAFTQFSYTTFGQNLDLRPYGAAIIPTPVPKCPNCNLVFFDNLFTEEEITILSEVLAINNLFTNESNMPNYYYLAREAEIVGRDINNIIWWFLSSVWENGNEDKNLMLINITIENINKLVKTDEAYNNYQMVKLDLLRRSGQFKEALKLIEKIKTNEEYYKGIITTIINRQIELIENRDQKEHPIPRNN